MTGAAPATGVPPLRPFERIRAQCAGLGAWRMPAPGAGSGPLVVCFVSNGYRVGPNRIEFGRLVSSSGRPALFFAEAAKAFYSTAGLADRITQMVREEMERVGAASAVTIGFSQGGFGAIAFAERFPVHLALALSPRWSPDSGIVADARGIERKGALPFPTLAPGLQALGRAVVLHGMRGPDRRHLRRFPAMPLLEHWLLFRAGHEVHHEMRRLNLFAETFLDVLSDDPDSAVARFRAAGLHRAGSLGARIAMAAAALTPRRFFPSLSTDRIPQSGARP